MKLADWLNQSTKTLTQSGIATSRLDCLVLLEDLLHTDRAQLLAHPELELSAEQESKLIQQIQQRAKHIPLAYIRGKSEFYGREFIVNQNVLEPRPETETMIDLVKKLPLEQIKTIIDVGTGSGAIAITTALELTTIQAIAIDIDQKCLDVARRNCELHKTTVNLKNNNILEGINLTKDTVVLANLPYVPKSYTINNAAMNEPAIAIFGGEDGLDLYRTMFEQLSKSKSRPIYLLTESLPFQHEALAKIAAEHDYTQQTEDDFIQIFTSKH